MQADSVSVTLDVDEVDLIIRALRYLGDSDEDDAKSARALACALLAFAKTGE